MIGDGLQRPLSRLGLLRLGYGFERLFWLSEAERRETVGAVVGNDLAARAKPSNGVFLAILALARGCPKVVMTGFSLSTAGHAYNKLNHPRNHTDADRELLRAITLRTELPVFANDRSFAEETGLPLFAPQ
jgi:hypothetical protein